eukprot:362077-Chlamydomonas_euryale.AAC.11
MARSRSPRRHTVRQACLRCAQEVEGAASVRCRGGAGTQGQGGHCESSAWHRSGWCPLRSSESVIQMCMRDASKTAAASRSARRAPDRPSRDRALSVADARLMSVSGGEWEGTAAAVPRARRRLEGCGATHRASSSRSHL